MNKIASLKKPVFGDLAVSSKSEAARAFAEAKPVERVSEQAVSATKGKAAPAGHKRLTINLPVDLHKQLRLKALESGTTATDIIESLLRTSI